MSLLLVLDDVLREGNNPADGSGETTSVHGPTNASQPTLFIVLDRLKAIVISVLEAVVGGEIHSPARHITPCSGPETTVESRNSLLGYKLRYLCCVREIDVITDLCAAL